MKKKILYSLALILISFISCNPTEPPDPPKPDNRKITLTFEDASCTEVWLTLETENISLPASINILLNDSLSNISILNTQDSLLYIDSLFPNKTYTFKAELSSIENPVLSNELTVTTMDTTSHNFTWQTFTFGDHSSSTLYDVAIIDENNIWAVGEIYANDSLGNPDPNAYNAVHWNGSKWQLKRIRYFGSCSAVEYPPLRAIWAFSENNIVLTNGGSIGWFDGNTITLDCGVNQLLTGAINKICGVSSNDLYVVGNNGTIAHYNGSQWRKIESGTSSNINDIWGVMNDNTSLILGAVSNRFQVGDYKLLSLSSVAASDTLMWNFQRLYGLWFISKRSIYVVGDDIHIYKNNKWETLDITDFFLTRIKGTALNNIYISGCCNQLFHFNGKSWKAIEGIYGNYEGLDSKDDLIVAVGWAESNAVILRGRRTN